MTNEVLKADETNLLRDGGPWTLPGHPKSGDKPRPIRRRAFFRALKRGELWAIVPYRHMLDGGVVLNMSQNRFARVIPEKYCPENTAYICWPWGWE